MLALTRALRDLSAMAIVGMGAGITATLRQSNTVVGPLYVHGGASTGASSITATSGDGRCVWGAQLSIQGVTGTYTLTQTEAASGGFITLEFTPSLAGPAADGAAVTFLSSSAEWAYFAQDGASTDEVDKEIVAGKRSRALVFRPDAPAPAIGDTLDGQPITAIHSVSNPTVRYEVTVTAP